MYYWVYYKTISSIKLPTILYITPDNFRVCKENPYMIIPSICDTSGSLKTNPGNMLDIYIFIPNYLYFSAKINANQKEFSW